VKHSTCHKPLIGTVTVSDDPHSSRLFHTEQTFSNTLSRTTGTQLLSSVALPRLTVALMLQCCVRLSSVCPWRYVLWLNGVS